MDVQTMEKTPYEKYTVEVSRNKSKYKILECFDQLSDAQKYLEAQAIGRSLQGVTKAKLKLVNPQGVVIARRSL